MEKKIERILPPFFSMHSIASKKKHMQEILRIGKGTAKKNPYQ